MLTHYDLGETPPIAAATTSTNGNGTSSRCAPASALDCHKNACPKTGSSGGAVVATGKRGNNG